MVRCIGLVFFAGVFVTLFTTANPQALTRDAQLHEPNLVSFASPGGVQEGWVARYDGPDNYDDEAVAIAVDGSGNVYVTGRSDGSGTAQDYATIKYNSAGQQQWVARYDGPGGNDDVANAIAVDGSGNVYVTGSSYGSGTDRDYATIKYVQGATPTPTPPPHRPTPRPRPTPASRPTPR